MICMTHHVQGSNATVRQTATPWQLKQNLPYKDRIGHDGMIQLRHHMLMGLQNTGSPT